ncbi:polyketide synthase dehydratase domain-containing protein [Actinoplanes sp. KI2]|uniref:beta-ketoacyl synthase N-terminal-like domain-containing protein n=1 Tax=Actinoplanes sp. KI2 TaxID=2983315 RepID=UPI0021D5ECD7|nr:beta-ketoacyl synthase N-terminal-like domain-containing protein [Actinoplanes sp. KI2]MCU7723978.1 polyketide synthase dehydratase domain-containing protein [Actinoplanes sp. KI2]
MEQIAIVGMAALFPGSADLDQYWRNVVAGKGCITDVPPDRFDELFYDPENAHRPDRFYCRRGGFLDEAAFEPLKFGIMPNSVTDIEPDQLISLEVASAAITDAGGPERMPDADRIGVILGRGGLISPGAIRYSQRVRVNNQVISILRELLPDLDEERLDLVRDRFDQQLGKQQPEGAIGVVPNLAASRVANRLNLRGPAYTIDAACASSLLAVDQGMTELSSGRLDAVLAGGTHHVHDISFWSVFNQLQALSRTGDIRPFDAGADGMLVGEGTGFVVLKRLADAERAGDRVYAVIRGSGTSSDGRSASMFNPASSGQALAIRRAWEMAGLDPTASDALGLLEAHGTGTPTGDAAELTTLAEVFGGPGDGERPVIGSVKSMIGHAMPAAGIAGLIKAALAVYHGVLPPTVNCDEPRAEMARTRFTPIAAAKPWPGTGPRRAGVNAFGFGGVNAHVVIEQHVAAGSVTVAEPDRVVWLSADSPAELGDLLDRPDAVVRGLELAGEVAGGRTRLGMVDPTDQRIAAARRMVARGAAWRGGRDIWFTPRPLLGAGGGRLAFVYPGVEAEFAPRTADVAGHFGLPYREFAAEDLGRHGTGLLEVGRLLDGALRRMNVRPDAVAGHSIGEWTAAVITGQMSVAGVDAFLSVFDANKVEISGYAFAAISAPAETVTPLLAGYPGVLFTHDNAPTQCVVNGPREQVQRLVDDLRADNVLCQLLPFRSAFHTPVFAEGLQAIGAALGRWEPRPTEVPVWSGTLAAPFPTDPDEVNQLFIRHMIEPVRFRQTVNAMYDAGIRVFLQVGPGQLATLIDDNLRGKDHLAMPVNVSRRSGMDQLRRVATALWVDGGEPDLHALDPAPAAATPRVVPERLVAGPAARKGPSVRLDLSGALVKLGPGAADLLGISATPAPGRPPAPAPAAVSAADPAPQAAALTALNRMASTSSAAKELVALLQETAHDAVTVMNAAAAPSRPPAPRHLTAADNEVLLRTSMNVSIEDMPYLLDHCFFAQPDDWPRVEDRWPVVPATTMVQFMMDAAEQAVPGWKAIGVREAKFNRWLKAAPPQRVDVTVKRVASNLLSVALGGYARSVIEVGTSYPEPPEPAWSQDPATEFPPSISAEQMYAERLMFHGPQFQGVTAVYALGNMHVRGEVTTPVPPGGLLDNALQLIGNWLPVTQPFRTVALPVGIGHVTFYGPQPAPGTAFDCLVRIRTITDTELVADAQLSIGGRVWAQIDGATDRRFDSHPIAKACERFPERYPMSQRRPEGWAVVFDAWTDLVTRGMAVRSILGADAAIEYDRMAAAKKKPWMLGRIAAKDAVRFRQWDAGHTDVFPVELTIRNLPSGQPFVELRPGRGLVDSALSLAHTEEVAVAISGPAGAEVGIDIVEIAPRDDSTLRYALSEAEIAQLGTDRDRRFARIWAAKEAVGKALGTGLGGSPRRFEVSLDQGTVTVDDRTFPVAYQEIENPPDLPPRRYVVAWTSPAEK